MTIAPPLRITYLHIPGFFFSPVLRCCLLQNEEFLAEVRAAAETEMKRSANRRDAILEERDRALEQVHAALTQCTSIECTMCGILHVKCARSIRLLR